MTIDHGLILAAGSGGRMGELTCEIPKAMLEIDGSTLISRVIGWVSQHVAHVHVTVGHHASMLAAHVVELGASSAIVTSGHGNAWWLHNSLAGSLDGPILVAPCDVVMEIDHRLLLAEYRRVGEPPCMLVAVQPAPGIDGDYITAEGDDVVRLSRTTVAATYCSGLQVIDPARVVSMTDPCEDFGEIWAQLADRRMLKVSSVRPTHWVSCGTPDQLRAAQANVAPRAADRA